MLRIGIDVGGTHTDAALLNDDTLLASTKAATSADVATGITDAFDAVLADGNVAAEDVQCVMIGTTQFTNAVVERRELASVAAIRIGLPSGKGLPPFTDWPEDIETAIAGMSFMVAGGYLYDGELLAPLDEVAIDQAIAKIAQSSIRNIAIASAFSPLNADPEESVAARIKAAIPDANITCSHTIGGLGLLERENAAILNASLLPFAKRVVSSFEAALKRRDLNCPLYVSQNDGTLMGADFVRQFPALTFASGPTNSLRGAWKLTGLENAIVVDIGGTTSDIGVLQSGFPRESYNIVDIGGVRTNFRMPDILAIGVGGGSVVGEDGTQIGPQSVGHRLTQESLIFGGQQLTLTDIAVAAEAFQLGDPSKVDHIPEAVINTARETMHQSLNQAIDSMRPGGRKLPVILVGGGAALVTATLDAATQTIVPNNSGTANAIGAAIAQIGGEAEQMLSYRDTPRDEALAMVTAEAEKAAIAAGGDPQGLQVVDVTETPVPYMDEGAMRLRVKVVGTLAATKPQPESKGGIQ
ncbi:MAG: hydantoinase/oxoprolinase family protein [Erythrobacter sp.]